MTELAEQLQAAFDSKEDEWESTEIKLGPLQGFESLFPDEFNSNDKSLLSLSGLGTQSKAKVTPTDASMQVLLGNGFMFETDLYTFFKSHLKFYDEKGFHSLLKNTYSLHIVGGSLKKIVAAVIFTAYKDGVFLFALAVSHGGGSKSCKLKDATFYAKDEAQKQLFKNTDKKGTFHNLGLGTFLLSLVAYCGGMVCQEPNAGVFLKADHLGVQHYTKRGFSLCEKKYEATRIT